MERSGADADRWKAWRRRKTCVWTWSSLLTETGRLETFTSQTFHFLLDLHKCWADQRFVFQSGTEIFVVTCDGRVAVTVQKQERCQFWVTAVTGPHKTALSSTIFNDTTFVDTGLGNTWPAGQFIVISNRKQWHAVSCYEVTENRNIREESRTTREKVEDRNPSCCKELAKRLQRRKGGGIHC